MKTKRNTPNEIHLQESMPETYKAQKTEPITTNIQCIEPVDDNKNQNSPLHFDENSNNHLYSSNHKKKISEDLLVNRSTYLYKTRFNNENERIQTEINKLEGIYREFQEKLQKSQPNSNNKIQGLNVLMITIMDHHKHLSAAIDNFRNELSKILKEKNDAKEEHSKSFDETRSNIRSVNDNLNEEDKNIKECQFKLAGTINHPINFQTLDELRTKNTHLENENVILKMEINKLEDKLSSIKKLQNVNVNPRYCSQNYVNVDNDTFYNDILQSNDIVGSIYKRTDNTSKIIIKNIKNDYSKHDNENIDTTENNNLKVIIENGDKNQLDNKLGFNRETAHVNGNLENTNQTMSSVLQINDEFNMNNCIAPIQGYNNSYNLTKNNMRLLPLKSNGTIDIQRNNSKAKIYQNSQPISIYNNNMNNPYISSNKDCFSFKRNKPIYSNTGEIKYTLGYAPLYETFGQNIIYRKSEYGDTIHSKNLPEDELSNRKIKRYVISYDQEKQNISTENK